MKHYLKYVAAPLMMSIWSLASAEASTPMKIWFNTDCQGFGYDWYSSSPPAWAGSYQPQGSPICYENNSSFLGLFDDFLNCIEEGRGTASALDHAVCLLSGIVVTGAVAGSIVGTGGLAASGWLMAAGLLTGATAGVAYNSICYCALHAGP